ncbi:MAG: Nif3-like dinuclear metal center hexameric protein [Bacteroidales bacterium]|nr:Nif3-like dinuclear metal center hexameric protein [Bacteroidales bacterium]
MKIQELIHPLEELAPGYLQEAYDNSGLLVGDLKRNIEKAIITLDVTEKVLEEANDKKAGLIIAHHPLIFKGIKGLTGKNAVERMVETAIKNDIAIYAIHTNLDNVDTGVNAILCKKLGIKDTRILDPKKDLLRKLVVFCPVDDATKVREAMFDAGAGHIGDYDSCSYNITGEGSFRGSSNTNPYVGEKEKLHFEKEIRIETIYPVYHENKIIRAMIDAHPYEEVAYDIYPLGNEFGKTGAGMIGFLKEPEPAESFLNKVKDITKTGCIRYSGDINRMVTKVAVCGGAGSFLIGKAKQAEADIFLTGDIKYHDFFESEEKMVIADIGHYESEQFTKELIHSVLIQKFPTFAVLISETNTNAVNYL